jgi:hypothetical protein
MKSTREDARHRHAKKEGKTDEDIVAEESILESNLDDALSSNSTNTDSNGPDDAKNHTRISDGKTDFESNLAKQGTLLVDILRYTVIALLLLSSIGVSVVVLFLTKRAQQQQFDAQYYGAADKITTPIGTVIDRIGMINTVGVAATIQGMNESYNTTYWPFVTLPSFEQRVSSAKAASWALLISILPIVTEKDRDKWEIFAVEKGATWM